MPELKTEHLFDAFFTVTSEAMDVGEGPWGYRLIVPVTGGTFEGPKMKGCARNFGADWVLFRKDGILDVDVRIVLETVDKAFIHMSYRGVLKATKEDFQKLVEGKIKEPIRVQTAPRFETGHPKYSWLNVIQGVGSGEIKNKAGILEVHYSIFAMR